MTTKSSLSKSKPTSTSTSTAPCLPAQSAEATVPPPTGRVNGRNPNVPPPTPPLSTTAIDTHVPFGVANVPAPVSKPVGTPLRQRFTEYLILQQKAPRTVEAYVVWIRQLAAFHHKSPDLVSNGDLRTWLLHLITVRKLSASSVNLAINALRAFHGGFLGRDVEPLLQGIQRPPRKPQPPRIFSVEEVERLLNVGTAGDPLARAFLMTVFACGLRLSEATHIALSDLDSARMQLRVSHPKGGRQRLVPLTPELLQELRQWWRVHRPERWLFSQGPNQEPICKATGQNLFYRACRRAGLQKKLGIHALRHTFATLMLESGVEITVVQRLLGHAALSSTVRYLHVRQERLAQIRSPLGLLRLGQDAPMATPTVKPPAGSPSNSRPAC